MAIALMTGAMGCSVDVLEVEQEESLKIVFDASPFLDGDSDADTRTSVVPNETYTNYEFIWSAKDTVGIYPDAGSQIFFTMENGAGASSATFDGGAWTCKEGHTFRSYYPFIGNIYLDATKIPVSFTGQKQVGNDNSDHFQKYDYMYTAATTKDSGFLNFSYSHLITAVLPWVELPAGHYTGLTLSLKEALFVTEGEYDLTAANPAIVGKKYSNSMSIELDVTFTSPDILKVYVPLAPMDMSGKTLTITITDEDGREFQYTYEPSKPYVASKIYRLKSATSFVQQDNVIYYTSSDGDIVTPNKTDVFGANIVSNEYVDGRGVITFDGVVTSIGEEAFFSCSSLTSVTIPNSVTQIGDRAFRDCSALVSVEIPDGVTFIGGDSFQNCINLASFVLPENVTEYGAGVFSGCISLTSVVCPRYIAVPYGMFSGCSNLQDVTIPEGVDHIASYAFRGCTSLTALTLPESLTSIVYLAFEGCTSLTSITIPENVNIVYFEAFYGCTSLSSIYVLRTSPPAGGSNMFYGSTCPIYVPAGSVDAYKSAEHWSDYADRIQAIPSTTGEINGHAYVDMGNGLKWATCNVGANSPEEYGDYFAWGEIITYYTSLDPLTWRDDYRRYTSMAPYTSYYFDYPFTIYTKDTHTVLLPENDAAHCFWGGTWRMPTDEEWITLIDYSQYTWTWDSVKKGFTVKCIENGNTIFLPAAGTFGEGSELIDVGTDGIYWSSSLSLNYNNRARVVDFNGGGVAGGGLLEDYRFHGLSVRPVSN